MRLDRFITLNLVHPLRRALGATLDGPCRPAGKAAKHEMGNVQASGLRSQISALEYKLPVLMYHRIADDSEAGVHPYYRVCTSPRRFHDQMQWLKNNGCRGMTLSAGLAWLREQTLNSQLSTRDSQPVVLTFDDGFSDFYTDAWPVLQEFGFTATMYLPTGYIGSATPSPRREEGRGEVSSPLSRPRALRHAFHGNDCMLWNEVREMNVAGIEFGSHTVNHPKLVELPWSEVELEIRNSKSEIENRLGVPCPAFAYPYAFPKGNNGFAPRFTGLVASSGYRSCVTTEIGCVKSGDNPYCLKRLPVNSLDDAALFAAKLAGSYDWLAPLQSGFKRIKSALSTRRTQAHRASDRAGSRRQTATLARNDSRFLHSVFFKNV